MIFRRFRKAVLLLLILTMIPAASLAGSVDDLLNRLSGPAGSATELVFSAEAVRVPQFSNQRTEWLNGLLKHLVFRITSDGSVQEQTIGNDGKDILGCITRQSGDGSETRFSFSDAVYRTEQSQDILSLLTGSEPEENDIGYYAQIRLLLPEFYEFFGGLPELFPENTSESKVSIQYKGYGTAVKRYSIVLDADVLQSERMAGYLSRDELNGVRSFLSSAVLSGKQRLTLLKDADGNLMKVNYTAKCGLSEDSMRNTDIDWKCLHRENGYKDVLVLKTPAVSGSDRHNLSVTRESVTQEDGTEEYQCSVDTDEVESRIRKRIRLDISLTAKDGKITGSAVKKTTSTGLNDITGYQVEIQAGEYEHFQGSLEISHELNKIEREHYRIQFTAGPCEPPVWPEGNGETVNAAESDLQMIRNKAAAVFLKAMTGLPEEDLQYIIADLPDNWWKQSIQITEKPEETEKP